MTTLLAENPTEIDHEDIEGLGTDEDSSWSEYPIDTLLIRQENRTVHDILRRIDQGMFVMDPDFQRDFIWGEEKQSKLIESVLMRIPLPVMYLAEDSQGRMIVVDGLQRLSTFKRFIDNELRLKLPEKHPLHRKRFSDLSPKHQNRIEDCNLILYVIDSKAPEQTLLDIFERVNSGVTLTRQQMRNCLYMGPGTRFLKKVADSEIFKKATGNSLNIDTMRDREFVNRFCSFALLSLDKYQDMDQFLALGLKTMNELPEEDLEALKLSLENSLDNNLTVFGKHAFRKHEQGRDHRNIINASLWDVWSVGLAPYASDVVKSRKDDLKALFFELLEHEEFVKAVTIGTSQKEKVHIRFHILEQRLGEILGDQSA